MDFKPDIRVANSGQDWAAGASELIVQVSKAAIQARGRCLVALSGGSTPKTLYQTWAHPDWSHRFDWNRFVFLFGDERCVPQNHPESNYAMAQAALFQPLGIQPGAIHRMEGERPDPLAAARDYEVSLRALTHSADPAFPELDLILLGLGEDGHTASLFPGTAALQDQTRLVTVGHAPKGITLRLTLTLGVINRASMVLFLVTGASKARIVKAILEPSTDADRRLPAALVKPDRGRLIWLLDRPASGELTGT
jgi:6-phosphogluconolactonase